MQYNFQNWYRERLLTEAMVGGGGFSGGYNPFQYFDQKGGDLIFFGIHLLNHFIENNGHLPKKLDLRMIEGKYPGALGIAVDADEVKGIVTAITKESPFKVGYQKLVDKSLRKKWRGGAQQKKAQELAQNSYIQNAAAYRFPVEIPRTKLKDVTDWFTSTPNKIWLVIDAIPHQAEILRKIERLRGQPAPGQTSEISPEEIQAARTTLRGDPSESPTGVKPDDIQAARASLRGDPAAEMPPPITQNQPSLLRFRRGTREVEPAGAEAKPTWGSLFPNEPAGAEAKPTWGSLFPDESSPNVATASPEEMQRRNQMRQRTLRPGPLARASGMRQQLAWYDPELEQTNPLANFGWRRHDDHHFYEYFEA